MTATYKKSIFTRLADGIDAIRGFVLPKLPSGTHYPYEEGIEERWDKSGVIFAPIEKQLYAQLFTLNQQTPHATWQINTIELTVPAIQYDRVINFLIQEFEYHSPTHFNKNKLILLIKNNIFELDFYQHIDVVINPKFQLIIHQRQSSQEHLLENRPICVYETLIDITLSNHATSNTASMPHASSYHHSPNDKNDTNSKNSTNIKTTHKKSVQLRIYDERGKSVICIDTFPAVLGVDAPIALCGMYVSGEHIRLDFDENHQLIVENISQSNPIFVGDIKLNKSEHGVIEKSTLGVNDYLYITTITHDDKQMHLFPRIEVIEIDNGKPAPVYQKTRITPQVDDNLPTPKKSDLNKTPFTPLAKLPITPVVVTPKPTLFNIILTTPDKEEVIAISQADLPCLVGRLGELPDSSVYKKLICLPSYYQGNPSTVSREHMVIEDFQEGKAHIRSLGVNGCFVADVKQDDTFLLMMDCQLRLGADNPPVTLTITAPQ